MKKVIKLISIVFLATSVAAQAEEPTPIEACGNLEAMAADIMEGRQEGQTMANQYERLIVGNDTNESAKKMFLGLLKAAYQVPNYEPSEIMQRNAVDSFRNQIFQACMEKFDK